MTLDDTSTALVAAFGPDVEFRVISSGPSGDRPIVGAFINGIGVGPLLPAHITALAAHLNAGIALARELGEEPTIAALGR